MGIDQSISGTGVVILKDGKLIHKELIAPNTNILKFFKQTNQPLSSSPPYKMGLIDENGKNLVKVKDRTKEQKNSFKVSQSLRINYLAERVEAIIKKYKPDLAGMEEIAFGGTGQLASLGHVHGSLQRDLFRYNIPFIVINIMIVKRYATGSARAQKNAMIAAIDNEDEAKFLLDDIPEKNEDDLADAYHIGRYIHDQKDDLDGFIRFY